MIIGLTGFKQAGKDSTADVLCSEFGFEKLSFADALRNAAAAVDPLLSLEGADTEIKSRFPTGIAKYNDLIGLYGYEAAKNRVPDVRRYLQVFGTEAIRNNLGDDVWIKALEARIPRRTIKKFVVTDCRFQNEVDWILDRGELWRIKRTGQVNTDLHPSEAQIDLFVPDVVIEAETLDELQTKARTAWLGFKGRSPARAQARHKNRVGEETFKTKEKWRHIQSTYGLTQEQYQQMLTSQDGGCATMWEK